MESSAQVRVETDFMAQVIAFPMARSCWACAHWRSLDQGATSWCDSYSQTIDDETYDAVECFAYEHCPEGEQPLLDEDPRE